MRRSLTGPRLLQVQGFDQLSSARSHPANLGRQDFLFRCGGLFGPTLDVIHFLLACAATTQFSFSFASHVGFWWFQGWW